MLISNPFLRWILRPYAHARCRRRCDVRLTPDIRFIPPSWRPCPFQTSGDLEQWRNCLRALGIKLAVISVCSFACKAVLVALKFFDVVADGSVYLGTSTLLAEALPSLLTIVLLVRYHSGSIGAAQGGDIGVSLLTQEVRDRSAIEAAVERESRDAGCTQATVDANSEAWLAQFMSSGRVIGAAARLSKVNGNSAGDTSFKVSACGGP